MINVLAVCDHAKHSVAGDAFDSVLRINQGAPKYLSKNNLTTL